MRCLIRLFIAVLLCASSGAAASYAEPRFHLQAIEVRGVRHVSSGVVIAASLLEAGRVYTESELRDAARRVDRLPFVLAADLALERGRERGTYVLVLDVREARRFFFEAGLVASDFDEPLALDDDGPAGGNLALTATVGARAFLGRHGVLFAAADDEGVQAGFSHYRLFGSRLFLSLGLAERLCCATEVPPLGLDPAFSAWIDEGGARNASLTLGVPLGADQALRASFSMGTGDHGFRRPVLGAVGETPFDYRHRTQRAVRLAWLSDTTDDPLFPATGTSLVVALDARSLEADLATAELRADLVRLSVLGRRHWPVARRHAFAAGLTLAAGRSEVENLPDLAAGAFDVWEAGATIRHSMRLQESKTAPAFRQVYWVNELRVSVQDTSPGFGRAYDSLEVAVLSSGVVWRSEWGIVRIGVRLVDVGDVL